MRRPCPNCHALNAFDQTTCTACGNSIDHLQISPAEQAQLAALRERAASLTQPAPEAPIPAAPASPAEAAPTMHERLANLKARLNAGLITEVEYQKQRAKALQDF